MDTVVVSLGGSVLIPGEDDADHLNKLSGLLKEMSVEHRLLLVCGGGKIARYYIATGRDIVGASIFRCAIEAAVRTLRQSR